MRLKLFALSLIPCLLLSCTTGNRTSMTQSPASDMPVYLGTDHPFASEAVYFVVTDRFVDGDPSNNQEDQGGAYPTFNRPLIGEDGRQANVGYMGGDLKGVLDNAQYIADMGFTAIWLTPILDNPDQAFAGGEPITFAGKFKDGGKTGYHGYWANNFYQIDEHYPSENLDYPTYTQILRNQYGIKSIFDVVANHGSPSFSMPVSQESFGKLYDFNGNLVADHGNLTPEELDPNNPLHQFFHPYPDIMQLSNLNENSPALQKYLIDSYFYWIEQGADAFRIDTIKHVPHHFWQKMAEAVRQQHPDFFMFAESYSYDANFIAQHTLPKNGGISVLDFPGQQAMVSVFENPESDFSELQAYLHLTHGPYDNPYELTTFYDNHDMRRMAATDNGFINAHNWLFTTRGIPVLYQGSEMGFMRGTAEHEGNRNYYGQDNIEKAKQSAIHQHLTQIANIRKHTPALQRGLQLNLRFEGQSAAFLRVLQTEQIQQQALVLLNKGSEPINIDLDQHIQAGTWTNAADKTQLTFDGKELTRRLPANSVEVWLLNEVVENPATQKQLNKLMQLK